VQCLLMEMATKNITDDEIIVVMFVNCVEVVKRWLYSRYPV